MLSPTRTLRRIASRRQEGAGASALFLIGSVVSHGLLYGIAASVSSGAGVTEQSEPTWIEIAVQSEPDIVRAPEAAVIPEEVPPKVASIKTKTQPPPKPPNTANRVKRAAVTALTKQVDERTPSVAEHVVPSIDDAGVEESEEDSSVVVSNDDVHVSEDASTGPAGLGDGDQQKVDPRVVIRAWMKKVQRAVQLRAIRDYPRAAQRMRLQGNVFVAMDVSANGRVTNVRASRASGHDTLDEAAVEAVLAIGDLPSPPREFLSMGKPLTIPIAYRIR